VDIVSGAAFALVGRASPHSARPLLDWLASMKMITFLVAAIVAGAAAAIVSSSPSSTAASPPAITKIAASAPQQGLATQGQGIDGDVLEVLQVPNYSYLRVGEKGTEGTWTAVPTASVAVGDKVRVGGATRMTDFRSATLGRTFPVIYFGALNDASAKPGSPHGAVTPDPHAKIVGSRANGAGPHAGAATSAAVEPVARAGGANGMTVAEVNDRRTALRGKTVRIHATVVKANGGILGKTFLHVRDGSGDAAAGTHDLTVTTAATPAVGDTVTLEGVVVLDLDLGAGYTFPTIIENAKLVTP
jgi:hypothetical protein